MMIIKNIAAASMAIALSAFQLSAQVNADAQNQSGIDAHRVSINSFEDLQAYFHYSPKRDVIISGHRGGMMPGYPENCI